MIIMRWLATLAQQADASERGQLQAGTCQSHRKLGSVVQPSVHSNACLPQRLGTYSPEQLLSCLYEVLLPAASNQK